MPMPADIEIYWVEWANDDRLLIGVSKRDTERCIGRTCDALVSRVVAVDRNSDLKVMTEVERLARTRPLEPLTRSADIHRAIVPQPKTP